MTKPVEPSIPTDIQVTKPVSRTQLVRMQEYVRKNGVALSEIALFVLKGTCVECVLHNGNRKVLSYG